MAAGSRGRRWRKARGWAVLGASATVGVGIAAFVPAGIGGVLIGSAGVYIGYQRSVGRRRFDLADQGRFEVGRAHYEKVREKSAPGTLAHTMAVANLAYYLLREGRHAEAERAFADLIGETDSEAMKVYLRAALAALDVLRQVPDGERRALPDRSPGTDLLRAVVHAANGARERLEAISVRRNVWVRVAGIKMKHERRGVALLQAFVQHTAGEDPARARLERARAGYLGEYDYLLPPFSGLAAFIEEHGLYSACLPAATVRAGRA